MTRKLNNKKKKNDEPNLHYLLTHQQSKTHIKYLHILINNVILKYYSYLNKQYHLQNLNFYNTQEIF